MWVIASIEIKQKPPLGSFKESLKKWVTQNCPCTLCKTFKWHWFYLMSLMFFQVVTLNQWFLWFFCFCFLSLVPYHFNIPVCFFTSICWNELAISYLIFYFLYFIFYKVCTVILSPLNKWKWKNKTNRT